MPIQGWPINDPDDQDIAEMEAREEDIEIERRLKLAKEAMNFYWSMKNWECPNCFSVGEVYDSDMKCHMCGAEYGPAIDARAGRIPASSH